LSENLNPVVLSNATRPEGFRYKQLFGAVFTLGGLAGFGAFVYAIALTK
jgi:3-dehydroquinate dehydratase